MFSSHELLRKNLNIPVCVKVVYAHTLVLWKVIRTIQCRQIVHLGYRFQAAESSRLIQGRDTLQIRLHQPTIFRNPRYHSYSALCFLKNKQDVSKRQDFNLCNDKHNYTRRQFHSSKQEYGVKKASDANHNDSSTTDDWQIATKHPSGQSKFRQFANADAVLRNGGFASQEQDNSKYNIAARSASNLSHSSSKVDLSYYNIRQRELLASVGGQNSKVLNESFEFRDNSGLRLALGKYMLHIEPFIGRPTKSQKDDHEIYNRLKAVFTSKCVHYLQQQGYVEEDLMSWSWILCAKTIGLSIRRYVTLARRKRGSELQGIPVFISLQLLRASKIDSRSLRLLMDEIEAGLDSGRSWGNEAGSILLIRLLRHARLADTTAFERIAECAPRIIPFETRGDPHADLQRLTHFYNRFLSLLALPASQHPFLSVTMQQAAQLKIARYMAESGLQVPLNREGYRALARVQLMHRKTLEEHRWSSTKARSWPPWRQDELGIDANLEYPGRQSRVSKVIKRLLEAGYGPESTELELQILAGWDTDKSPTIQTRRVVGRRPLSWFKNIFKEQVSQKVPVDPYIWAARVTATRSIREAWVCFYAYLQATTDQKRELRVYTEMFHKLLARVQYTDQKHVPAPGDGKEVYPDPPSARDLVYVPEEPPSKDELYAQMIQDGIKPAGRLLPLLLDNASTLETGFQYIQDSTLGDVNKDVLLQPEKYPKSFIRNVYKNIPNYLLTSYIGLVTRQSGVDEPQLFWPGSRSAEELDSLSQSPLKPLAFGMIILRYWSTTYEPAYHAVLEGICTQTRRVSGSRDFSYPVLWKNAKTVLALYEENGLSFDLTCYRKTVMILRNYTIRATYQFGTSAEALKEAASIVKMIFLKAIGSIPGDSNKLRLPQRISGIGQQPYWKDVENFLLILGFDGDFTAIVDVLKWMHQDQGQLHFVGEKGYSMQRLLCAGRVALEARWLKDNRQNASQAQIEEAREYCQKWGWPDDVDVDEYLRNHEAWFHAMRNAQEYSRQGEC